MERETEAQKEKLTCLSAQAVNAAFVMSTTTSASQAWTFPAPRAPEYTVTYRSALSPDWQVGGAL